jgi:hypothetical protein
VQNISNGIKKLIRFNSMENKLDLNYPVYTNFLAPSKTRLSEIKHLT